MRRALWAVRRGADFPLQRSQPLLTVPLLCSALRYRLQPEGADQDQRRLAQPVAVDCGPQGDDVALPDAQLVEAVEVVLSISAVTR